MQIVALILGVTCAVLPGCSRSYEPGTDPVPSLAVAFSLSPVPQDSPDFPAVGPNSFTCVATLTYADTGRTVAVLKTLVQRSGSASAHTQSGPIAAALTCALPPCGDTATLSFSATYWQTPALRIRRYASLPLVHCSDTIPLAQASSGPSNPGMQRTRYARR